MMLTWYAVSWDILELFHLVIVISLVSALGQCGLETCDVLVTSPISANVQKMSLAA